MAEALLRHRIEERGREGIVVSSAGFLPGGRPASDQAIQAMSDRGIALDGHVSREVDARLLDSADLVLCMARQHLRETVVLRPEAFPRTFTLKELVRRGEEVGPRSPTTDPVGWLGELHAERRLSEHLGDSALDDIADPVGRPVRVFRKTAGELDDLLARLEAVIF